jgi:hypothetical protein
MTTFSISILGPLMRRLLGKGTSTSTTLPRVFGSLRLIREDLRPQVAREDSFLQVKMIASLWISDSEWKITIFDL